MLLNLHKFDDNGIASEEFIVRLCQPQVEDIIDHAVQLLTVMQHNATTEDVANELHEALYAAGVVNS